jgi:hypothetical protein
LVVLDANQIAFAKRIPKSYLSCEGLCQNIEQVHMHSSQGQLLEKDNQRGHQTSKGHAAQLREFMQPAEVKVVKNVEHIVSMEGKSGGVLKNPKHKRKQRKKRLKMKEDDICQLSIIYS